MLIPVCTDCSHGGIKEGVSHCGKEKVYSYLTRCIAVKALQEYLERVEVEEVGLVGNQ